MTSIPSGGDNMGFPPANAIIIRNEAGEPLGWDLPEIAPDDCAFCGTVHPPDGQCWSDAGDDDVEYYARKDQERFDEYGD
jgi:hypothetical protein